MPGRPLYDALEELRSTRDDLQRANYQTFKGIFARYVALLKPQTPLGDVLEKLLPPVDFDSFYQKATGTIGGMVGSGALDFPIPKLNRVAMQRALLLRMGDDNPDLMEVTYHFFWKGSRPADHNREFVEQVIEPFQRDMASLVAPYLQEEKDSTSGQSAQTALAKDTRSFVDADRLQRFTELDPLVSLDLRKLISLCEELNKAFGNRAWHSVAFLTRTILNHIPPVFGHNTFAQVSAHASPKLFKAAADSLEQFGRLVADFHLHEPISDHLALASEAQVNVVQNLDVVLAEVERALAKQAPRKRRGP